MFPCLVKDDSSGDPSVIEALEPERYQILIEFWDLTSSERLNRCRKKAEKSNGDCNVSHCERHDKSSAGIISISIVLIFAIMD